MILARGQYTIKRVTGNRNLLNWQETWKEGSLPSGWSLNGKASENSVVLGSNPFGAKSLLWKCTPDTSSGDSGGPAGGYITPHYVLDNEHTYRYTAFVYREKASKGGIFHGCYYTDKLSGGANDNPYFVSASLPAGKWLLLVGYIHPSKADTKWQMSTSGIYDMSGKKIYSGTDYKLRNPNVHVKLRNYLYNTDNPEDVAYFYNPRLEVCDGNEPSIEQLLQVNIKDVENKVDTMKTTYDTEFLKTKEQIALKANSSTVSALGSRLNSAEAKITADAINLTVKSQTERIVANSSEKTKVTVDGTSLDPNKYYPITILLLTNIPQTITVERPLGAGFGVPAYTTHSAGFSMMCKWTSNGSGWGCSAVSRTVHSLAYQFVPSCPCGSIGQLTYSSQEYIYVRGGSKYNVVVEGAANREIILRTEDYTWVTSAGTYPQTIKVRDAVVAPEITYADKQETTATLKILSDKIESKVSSESFNALGMRVSSAESNITQQAGLIASKVSQSTFDALGNRVTAAETSISQTPNKIALAVSGSEEKIKSSLTLDSSGISLLGKKIALTGIVTFSSLASDAQGKVNTAQSTANSAASKADAAQGTANTANLGLNTLKSSLKDLAYQDKVSLAKLDETIVEGGYLKTNLIDANAIITSSLIAEKIAATDITTGRLTVTDGAKIGNMSIVGGVLTGSSVNLTDGAVLGGLKATGSTGRGAYSSLTNEGFNNEAVVVLRNDNNNIFCAIGTNVMPSSSGVKAVARFENEYSTHFTNFGLLVSAKNGQSGNIAIGIDGGCVSGFKYRVQGLSGSGTIETGVGFVQMGNTNYDPNVYLPSNPELGTIIYTCNANRAINVYGNGRQIKQGPDIRNYVNVTSTNQVAMFVYTGVYWIYNWLNR